VGKVRLQNREIKDRGRIDGFIGSTQVVRLGLISEGEPYVVPLNFVYEDGRIYFHCAREGRKYSAIRLGPRVCLEFDEMHGVSVEAADTFYTSVIAWGKVHIVLERELSRRTLGLLVKKYLGEEREITDTMADRTCIAYVEIEEITGKESSA